jgi:hypothetical protein
MDEFEIRWREKRAEEIAAKFREHDSAEALAFQKELERILSSEVERAAEDLAEVHLFRYDHEGAVISGRKGYEFAAQILFERLAERCDIPIEHLQLYKLRGGLGEFEEQTSPGSRPFHHRGLNNLIVEIRAMRLRMHNEYLLLEGAQYMAWSKKLRKIREGAQIDEPEAATLHQRDCDRVRDELEAIHALNVQLMNDKSWWNRHYDLHSKKKEAA